MLTKKDLTCSKDHLASSQLAKPETQLFFVGMKKALLLVSFVSISIEEDFFHILFFLPGALRV
jgi:hypothetical protein